MFSPKKHLIPAHYSGRIVRRSTLSHRGCNVAGSTANAQDSADHDSRSSPHLWGAYPYGMGADSRPGERTTCLWYGGYHSQICDLLGLSWLARDLFKLAQYIHCLDEKKVHQPVRQKPF